MFSGGVVAVVGSRSVPAAGAAVVARVARGLVGSGCSLSVGCCVGVDAAALSAVPVPALRVFAAFGPGGVGACRWSAVGLVGAFAARGGSVSWWAGGGPGVPLAARLVSRSRAVVAAASSGVVAFFASPASRGSASACRFAAGRGLPVLAFPLGFAGAALPALGAGAWVPAGGAGVWSGAWRWVPAQRGLL